MILVELFFFFFSDFDNANDDIRLALLTPPGNISPILFKKYAIDLEINIENKMTNRHFIGNIESMINFA